MKEISQEEIKEKINFMKKHFCEKLDKDQCINNEWYIERFLTARKYVV